MDTSRQYPAALKWLFYVLLIFCALLFPILHNSIPPVGAQEECYEYGDLRIVLNWDTNQTDIDLHTYDPKGNHAWYNNLGGIPGGNLDYDDVDGFGPENFTMAEPITGTYQIRLHYYADHNEGMAAADNTQARAQKLNATANAVNTPNALATTATVRVFVGSVLKFTGSHTLTGVGQWWDAHSFTLCGGKPVITAVTPTYKLDNTRFLEGIAVQNPIKVKVNWLGNAPGRVDFKLNDQIIATKEAAGDTVEHTLNMGNDLANGRNSLEIVAKAGGENGQQSDPKTFQFYSIPQPLWIAGLVNFGLSSLPIMASGNTNSGTSDAYTLDFKVPDKPFTIEALRFGPPDGKVKFDWEAGGEFVIPIDCSTAPSAKLLAKGGIEFWSSSVGLTGYGGLESQRSDACGFLPPNGFAGAKIEFTNTLYRKPVLVMISYFNVVVGQTVDTIIVVLDIEEFIGKLGEFYIDGTLSLDAQTEIEFFSSQTQFLKFKDLALDGSVGIQGGFRSDLVVVEVDVYAGASGGVAFVRPGEISIPLTSNWQFDKITLKGEVGAKFRAFWFTREAKGEISWTYPPTAAQVAGFGEQMHIGDWQLIPPMTALIGQPLQLQPNVGRTFVRPGQGAGASVSLGLQSTITEVLVSNVYTYPEVTLALNPIDDQALLLWSNTDNSKAVGQAQEIYASTWFGGGWTAPTPVTNDLLLDGAPQVAWTDGNQAVALWQRLNTPLTPDATLTTTTTRQVEIATATFNSATATWSPVTLLTNNGALDFMPHLVRNNNGQLLGVWRQNQAGQLGGDAANPDQVIAAFYDNNSWGTPIVALDNLFGLVDLSAGYSNANAVIAYTRNLAATGAVTPTGQLFVSTWDGLTWSASVQITDDHRNHRDPQLLYNNANQPLLLWLADNELNLRNLATNGAQSLALPTTLAGIDEFRALRDANGNLAAVFVSKSLPRDLYVVFYDEATQLWSNPRRLTQDNRSEAYLAPTFDSQNRLLMGYATTALTIITKTTTVNGEQIAYTLPQPTQTDLATLAHSFERNLTLTDAALTVSQLNPALGNTIILTATVQNSGDKPVPAFKVDFYADSTLIRSATIPGPVAGNSQLVVTTTYTINSLVQTLYVVVDPADTVAESNEFDNEAYRPLVGPDIEIIDTRVRYWGGANADLTTIVRNKGLTSLSAADLVYRHDNADATEVVRDSTPGLAPGAIATITTYLNLAAFPPGRYPMMVVAEVGDTGEFDTENNRGQFAIQILPDLHTVASFLTSSPLDQPTVLLTATIGNLGAAVAPATTVGFYRSSDTRNRAAFLASQPLVAITPTGAVSITQQLNGPLCKVYVSVDPTDALDELTKANNAAVLTHSGERCVDFYFAPLSGSPELPPYSVQFTDFSVGENNAWQWDFGDGATSTEQHPRHTYNNQGSYTVTLTVSGVDGSRSLTRAALIQITGQPNLAPIANNDVITTMLNTAITINVLSNDRDPNGDLLTITTTTQPQHGVATTDGATVLYTPTNDFVGTDTFGYTIQDSKGATASATVTVEIQLESQVGKGSLFLPLIQR